MGKLSPIQRLKIEQYLDQQGMTFNPLRDELLDHLITDIEQRMEQGSVFEETWLEVKSGITQNQLKKIEIETMAILNNKINVTKVFVFMALGLLALATIFKIFHFPGAGQLLLAFLGVTTVTLMVSTYRNLTRYPEKKGRVILGLVTLALILFLFYVSFMILHLPGADGLKLVSVGMIVLLFPALSIHFYHSFGSLKDHVILSILERNGKFLETIALIMIGFGIVFNLPVWLMGDQQFIGVVFFILTIVCIGLYAFSQTWSVYIHTPEKKNTLLLILSIIALISFMLPVLGNYLSWSGRSLSAFLAPMIYIGIIAFHYLRESKSPNSLKLTALCGMFLFYPIMRLLENMDWTPLAAIISQSLTFNIGWLLLLISLLLIFRRETYFRILVIFMIAMHMIPGF